VTDPSPGSRRTLLPLSGVEGVAVVVSRERDLAALWEVEDISRYRVHLVARLVTDVEAALEDDLHLVIRVLVDQRRALLEAVEAGGDGLLGVVLIAAGNVTQEGILICD